MTTITFVRHGHVYNPHNFFYGRLPGYPLSDEGRRQAQAAAETLRAESLAAVYSSPQVRAQQTAQIILASRPPTLFEISDLLDEVFTPFDGRPVSEVIARDWDLYSHVGPPYEQPIDVLNRILEFTMEARAKHTGQHVLAVTHGDCIVFMLLWAAGVPVTPQNKKDLRNWGLPIQHPAPASITTFVYRTDASDEAPTYTYAEPLQSLSLA
ncbi:MAG TPA: histidine phosphatase family protein [Anaerolineae bacterium]|nr:histidine phosphatase family protein [Anaerolineae bacterium]